LAKKTIINSFCIQVAGDLMKTAGEVADQGTALLCEIVSRGVILQALPFRSMDPVGVFLPGERVAPGPALLTGLRHINQPLYLVGHGRDCTVMTGAAGSPLESADGQQFSGIVPACPLQSLGDPEFCRSHALRYPYLAGSMAKGISSVEVVESLAQSGMLGFFGSAGLLIEEVEAAIDHLQNRAAGSTYGFNLIHSPNEPDLENALVDLYLRRGIDLVEASAFLALTPALVRYRTHGIKRHADGRILAPNRIIAKISREEVAAKFFAPPPEGALRELVAAGHLTAEQATLAGEIPMAQDVTVEADSGGHTDNRPALALFPTIQAQRNVYQQRYNYPLPLRVGLGGGIATPASAAAAFALGAAYLVTGTVNQACVESGTCDEVRRMLAEARQADVTMAPSGDMFEMGVKVQVLKRGTMFSMRAARLYELYRAHAGIEDLPVDERLKLEKSVFRKSLDQVWEETRSYFSLRDPRQLARAERDPKYKMALVFRWYLGQSPVWANRGLPDRKLDYQVWCGPAMGAFNEWARGSFLEAPEQRRVATVAWNILFGAAVLTRACQLKLQGVRLDDEAALAVPLEIERIKEFLS
jgi:PfaD family protein